MIYSKKLLYYIQKQYRKDAQMAHRSFYTKQEEKALFATANEMQRKQY